MFYVYVLIDPRSNKVFYIGKGSADRAISHENFKSGCNNKYKDNVIKKILKTHSSVPYNIIKEFNNEQEAYEYEEKLITEIGIKNLTNICDSRRPPNQKGIKRRKDTIEKIRKNSKKQGKERTITHVTENAELFYKILTEINNNTIRSVIVKQLKITIDLYNKVKRNYHMYVKYLNEYTDYNIAPKEIKKINGMKASVFYKNQSILTKMYEMINKSKKRKDIVKELNISFEFYDRMRSKEKEFIEYFKDQK